MKKIFMTQISPNEDKCYISELCVNDGDHVKEGQIILRAESSKAVEDIFSDTEGVIRFLIQEDEYAKVGEAIAIIYDDEQSYEEQSNNENLKSDGDSSERSYIMTKDAESFAQKHEINEADIRRLGKKLITEAELKGLINAQEDEPNSNIILSHTQRVVSDVVSRSASEIPQAFLLKKMYCDQTVSFINKKKSDYGETFGRGEIMIKLLHDAKEDFPEFFGKFSDTMIEISDEPGIGITRDMGAGLFMPVVPWNISDDLERISDCLLDYRFKAMDGSFSSEDVGGGAISISVNNYTDNVVTALPLVFPDQVAILSVGSVLKELAQDDDGNIIEQQYVNIGISYDHRALSGMRVAEFADRLARYVEAGDF